MLDFGNAIFPNNRATGRLGGVPMTLPQRVLPGDPTAQRADLISGLILGPLFLLAGATGMNSPNFRREVRAAMFGIGLANVLTLAANTAARTVTSRRAR